MRMRQWLVGTGLQSTGTIQTRRVIQSHVSAATQQADKTLPSQPFQFALTTNPACYFLFHKCPGGALNPCSGHGRCDQLTGTCFCDCGYGGTACNKTGCNCQVCCALFTLVISVCVSAVFPFSRSPPLVAALFRFHQTTSPGTRSCFSYTDGEGCTQPCGIAAGDTCTAINSTLTLSCKANPDQEYIFTFKILFHQRHPPFLQSQLFSSPHIRLIVRVSERLVGLFMHQRLPWHIGHREQWQHLRRPWHLRRYDRYLRL